MKQNRIQVITSKQRNVIQQIGVNIRFVALGFQKRFSDASITPIFFRPYRSFVSKVIPYMGFKNLVGSHKWRYRINPNYGITKKPFGSSTRIWPFENRYHLRSIIKMVMITSIVFLMAGHSNSWALTGDEILKNIDKNMVVDQALSVTKMIVHGRSGTRTIRSQVWQKGKDKSFVEYLSPAREKGKKMLKLGDKLWSYTPEPNDRIITIAGHLLRQSVMGSDLSYEDITENDKLIELYTAAIVGNEVFSGRKCVVIELTAKEENVAYHSRKVWVDEERWLPIKEDRFARSGRLLKTFEITDVFKQDNRWYPKRMIFKDMLSKGEGTEYIIESINFNVDIPDYKFSKASLRK